MQNETLETRNNNNTAPLFNREANPETICVIPPLMNEFKAGVQIGKSVHTMRKMRVNGTGPAFYKIGKSVRYRMSDILEYIEKSKVNR